MFCYHLIVSCFMIYIDNNVDFDIVAASRFFSVN